MNCASIPRELFESKFFGHVKASLCVESHLRYLLEQGFEIVVVRDATAAFQLPGLDGYAAALTNFQVIANAVTTTEEVKGALNAKNRPIESLHQGRVHPRKCESWLWSTIFSVGRSLLPVLYSTSRSSPATNHFLGDRHHASHPTNASQLVGLAS